jgi:hypothetical protein
MAGLSEEVGATGAPERNALYQRFVSYAASTTTAAVDVDKTLLFTSGSAQVYTLQNDAAYTTAGVAIPPIGATIKLVQTGAGTVTVAAGTATLTGAALATAAVGQTKTVIKTAANTWICLAN